MAICCFQAGGSLCPDDLEVALDNMMVSLLSLLRENSIKLIRSLVRQCDHYFQVYVRYSNLLSTSIASINIYQHGRQCYTKQVVI